MATSLAQQLQNIRQASSNNSFQKRKRVASILFSASEAADQDLDQVFAIASNGFEELVTYNHDLAPFGRTIFSDESRTIDRYTQTKEQNDKLDATLVDFVTTAAPYCLLRPMHKCLEWLVRRFNIHVHLSEVLLLSFLPFHTTVTFTKVLAIAELSPEWTFLSGLKKSNDAPSIILFAKSFSKARATLTIFIKYVQQMVQTNKSHHNLISIYADIAVRTIANMRDSNEAEEGIVSLFLPYVAEALGLKQHTEYQVANYMILTVLAASRSLSPSTSTAAMRSLSLGLTPESQKSGVLCLAQLCQSQEGDTALPSDVYSVLASTPGRFETMMALADKYGMSKLLNAFSLAAVSEATSESLARVQQIFHAGRASPAVILSAIAQKVLASAELPEFRIASATFLESLQAQSKYKKVLEAFYQSLGPKINDLELALQITLRESMPIDLAPKMRRQSSSRPVSDLEDDIAELSKLNACQTYLSVSDVRKTVNVLQIATSLQRFQDVLQSPVISETDELRSTFLVRGALSSNDIGTQIQAIDTLTRYCDAIPDTDFQALIPVVISLLSSKSREVRQQTLALADVLLQQSQIKSKKMIWGFDNLYGPERTHLLKWMSSVEAQSLLGSILSGRDECLLDHKVIYKVVGQSVATHGTKGKDLVYRSAGLQFLASHAIACPVVKVVLKVLLCFDKVIEPNTAKTKAILPLLERVIEDTRGLKLQSEIELIDSAVIHKLLVQQVVGECTPGISLLLKQVKLQNAEFGSLAMNRLTSVLDVLKREMRTDFIRALVEAIVRGPSAMSQQSHACIDKITIPSELFRQLIEEVNLSPPSSRMSTPMKKQKTVTVNQTMPELGIQRLTHLLEILERHEHKDATLLPTLFGKLGDLILIETESAISVNYTEQVLLSCINSMIKPGGFDSSTCRIDILINCIRTSSSPQVQNRALLLVASLAEAAPEQVLHAVMPIFTFMGANILRQDDGFSAHVIESTIQKIVPPLLVTLGEATQDRILGAAGILRSFVDAFPHIPRHRRLRLFLVLVETLGENVFLAPLLATLAQKRIETAPKNKSGESQQSYLEFCLSLLRHVNVAVQLRAVEGLLEIAQSIPGQAEQIPEDANSILSYANADDGYLDSLHVSIVSIIAGHFSAKKVRTELDLHVNDLDFPDKDIFLHIIEYLLRACDAYESNYRAQEKTLDALDRVITLLPVRLFEVVILDLLKSKQDEFLRIKVLDIISACVASTAVSDETARSSFFAILDEISTILKYSASASLSCTTLQCISSIGRRFGKADPGRFIHIAPLIIDDRGLTHPELIVRVASLECLTTIVLVLGPRILPHLQKFILHVLEGVTKLSRDEDADLVPLATISLLESLVKTIPSFMTPYTQTMIEKSADFTFASEELTSDKNTLLITIASNMPLKNLLEALEGAWEPCSRTGKKALLALMSTVEKMIEVTQRKTIANSAREILAFFLRALGVRQECSTWEARGIEQIEKRVIAVLLKVVLKLNDSTFRSMFMKLRDWSLSDLLEKDAIALQCRRITFFNFFTQFTETFKAIVLDYFNFVFEDILEMLGQAVGGTVIPRRLWIGIVTSLKNGFSADNEDFWRASDRFDRIAPLLVSHLTLAESYPVVAILVPAITELTAASATEEHFKLINTQVLQHFRAEKPVVRLAAVSTQNKLSAKMGDDWLSMLPQTIPFLAEALEDEDDLVEKQAHALAITIESFLGESLDTYLR